MKARVVFLDVDGVLNCRERWDTLTPLDPDVYNSVIDPLAVARLKRIVDASGADVVLSSTWRLSRDHRVPLAYALRQAGIRLSGDTPRLPGEHRGQEIDAWLDDHPEVGSFVILDDDSDMHPHDARLVHTSFDAGLLDEHIDQALALFAVEECHA